MTRTSHRHAAGTFDWLSEPKVSIIITTFNRRDLLPVAIRSVLTQQHRNLECIVVNDAGADVQDIIASFKDDKKLRLVTLPKNLGLAGARNAGLDAATGDYIGFLDDDDRLYHNHLRKLLVAMRENRADMAYADSDKIDLDQQNGRYVEVQKFTADQVYGRHDFDHNRILVENYIPVQCHLTAAYVFETVRFDPQFNPYEDWEWLISVSRFLHPFHLAESTSAFTERTDRAGMLAEGVMSTSRFDALQRIYAKWDNVGPQLSGLRQSVLENEMSRIIQTEQLRDIVDWAISAPDPSAYVKARKYWQTKILRGFAYGEMKRAQLGGDAKREEKINLILGALK